MYVNKIFGFQAKDKVKIIRDKLYPNIIGKIGTVSYNQDCNNKIKVDFDEKWQGYFTPTQLIKI